VTGSAKRKGDAAEREAAAVLYDELGIPVRRLLGAGRTDDVGDLDLPGFAVQVAWWPSDTLRAFRQKPAECETQQTNGDKPYGMSMIRMNGGLWRCVQTPAQFAAIYREVL
jgi:hypothetical protein